MDPCLNQPIPVALPAWRKYSKAPEIPGYTDVSSLTPIVGKFMGSMPDSEGQLNSDQMFIKLVDFEGSRECLIETVGKQGKTDKKKTKAFCKVSHLLDPALFVKNYYDHAEKGERRRLYKLNNPMNQAYIDTLANYLLGQLRERNVSPHFCQFYGGWKATADTYRFNITDEFESYRRYKDFWNRRREGKFQLYVEKDDSSDSSGSESQSSDELFATPNSSLRSTAFSYSSSSTDSHSEAKSHVSLSAEGEGQGEGQGEASATVLEELESVSTFGTRKTSVSSGSSSGSSDCSSENAYSVFVEMKSYPVMMIFQEEADGVLDDLLEDDEAVGAPQGSAEWEARWTAWTFQVIAALCAAQGVLGFTHNDLHTNNIVWTATDDSWLFYKSRDGTVWRIPTYGRILRLIDFGRAIFRVGEEWFISDDYESGGDAEGQYNFGRIQRNTKSPIYPNPSFDLCRYAVSIFEALFPEMPIENLEGAILSQEGDWLVRETESPLWNLLWSWLLDKNGKNVLREENGDERFPDFDLYQHITEKVTNVKPQDQLLRPIFSSYTVPANSVGDWETIYPLFC
jgi:hypothetical protein